MTAVEIGPATAADISEVLRSLRKETLEEIEISGIDPHTSLEDCLRRFPLFFSGKINNRVCCVWGVAGATLLSDEGYIWMVTTKAVDNYPFVFARQSRLLLDKIHEHTKCLDCLVVAKNLRSQKWLRWLGFEKINTQTVNGHTVLTYRSRRA